MAKLQMEKTLESLKEINSFLKENNITGSLTYRTEKSHLVRCGRSQISLNVSEEGKKLFVDLYKGKRKISGSIVGDIETEVEGLKKFISELSGKLDLMPEVPHLTEMRPIAQGDLSRYHYDENLVQMDSSILVSLFQDVVKEFEKENVEVSGAFSAGAHSYAVINTLVEDAIYYKGSDWNVEVVVQLKDDSKKEIRSADVGEFLETFDSKKIVRELREVYDLKTSTRRESIEPGKYDVVFTSDAFGEMTNYMSWVALHGESFEYQAGMISKDKFELGQKVFGDNVTITDDPSDPDILFV